MADSIYLVAGLGNPGDRYEGTRHNVGFDLVDLLATHCKLDSFQEKWCAFCAKGAISSESVCCIKPLTYMNKSGEAVARFANFYKIPAERILVIHDDLDMGLGRLKLVAGGGTGGHNGIRSIQNHLGSKEFLRLKIGIGRPPEGVDFPVDRYVLTKFTHQEQKLLVERYNEAIYGIELFFRQGLPKAMGYINSFK